MRSHHVDIQATHAETLSAVGEAASLWGGEWHRLGSGGALGLPVSAGLRLGELKGQVSTERSAEGTRLVYHVQESHYRLRLAHFVVLLLGGIGGVVTVLVPFFPALVGLVPLAGLLLLLAWFLVASRLSSSGAEEFLDLVRDLAEGEGEASAAEESRTDGRRQRSERSRRSGSAVGHGGEREASDDATPA